MQGTLENFQANYQSLNALVATFEDDNGPHI